MYPSTISLALIYEFCNTPHPYPNVRLIVKVHRRTMHILPAVVRDDHPLHAVLDHLEHGGMIGAVEIIVKPHLDHHRHVKHWRRVICAAYGGMGEDVPVFRVLLSLCPVFPGIVGIEPIRAVPRGLPCFGGRVVNGEFKEF